MLVSRNKKFEYWNHFVCDWALSGMTFYGPDGKKKLTPARLRRAADEIFADEDFWVNVVGMHHGRRAPEEMRAGDPATYQHCKGNFWGQVQTFIQW